MAGTQHDALDKLHMCLPSGRRGFTYSCFLDGEVVVWERDVSKVKSPHCVGWIGMQSEGWCAGTGGPG